MLTIYDLDNPARVERILSAVLQDKNIQHMRYKNVSAGQDATFLVNDTWIVKLGLDEDDYYKFDDQRDLIQTVRPYMTTVRLPDYEAKDFIIDYGNGETDYIHAARYQKLGGIVLNDFEDLKDLPRENRVQIMADLAQVFHDLHRVPIEKVEEFFPYSPYQKIRRCIAELRPDFYDKDKRNRNLMVQDVMRQVYPGAEFCFCHRDLRPKNFCLSEKLDHVTGVFDFGCAEIDLPQNDIFPYLNNREDLMVLVKNYEALSGRRLGTYFANKGKIILENSQDIKQRVVRALQVHERG